MARLGAVTAAALEGGNAASLAFDGRLLNRPTRGERPMSEMLGVLYSGVYAAPPEPAVLSPNGDGIDERQTFRYRVVRPSSSPSAWSTRPGTAHVVETGDSASPAPTADLDRPAGSTARWRRRALALGGRMRRTTSASESDG